MDWLQLWAQLAAIDKLLEYAVGAIALLLTIGYILVVMVLHLPDRLKNRSKKS